MSSEHRPLNRYLQECRALRPREKCPTMHVCWGGGRVELQKATFQEKPLPSRAKVRVKEICMPKWHFVGAKMEARMMQT